MSYVVGFNMPGYMPEMEPYECETAADAKQAMIDELLRHADSVADFDEEDLATELSHAAEDLNISDVKGGWGIIVGNTSYWIEPSEGEAA